MTMMLQVYWSTFVIWQWDNFVNVLCAAFTCRNPKSTKETVELSVFFALLGSGRLKAFCKMLMKLTPCLTLRRCCHLICSVLKMMILFVSMSIWIRKIKVLKVNINIFYHRKSKGIFTGLMEMNKALMKQFCC